MVDTFERYLSHKDHSGDVCDRLTVRPQGVLYWGKPFLGKHPEFGSATHAGLSCSRSYNQIAVKLLWEYSAGSCSIATTKTGIEIREKRFLDRHPEIETGHYSLISSTDNVFVFEYQAVAAPEPYTVVLLRDKDVSPEDLEAALALIKGH